MDNTATTLKAIVLSLLFSTVIIAVFFLGALADRLFVIKPLDALVGREGQPAAERQLSNPLRELLQPGEAISVADVAQVASDSVVTVAIQRQQPIFRQGGFGFFNFQVPTGETEQIQQDIGTGFVVTDDGLVVTNKHVVSDPQSEYLVVDKDGVEHQVTNIYRDPTNDLAILRVSELAAPPLVLGDSDQLRVGETAIAIGTALGEFRHTVTTGVISGLGRGIQASAGPFAGVETLEGVIQTDAAINPGNSGGPLMNALGEVVGVNVAVSAGAENIGFAIPINVVKASLDNFNETGQFERPFLGVRYQMISEEAALANEVPQGAYLLETVEGAVAAQAGLQSGDIVTRLAGEVLTTENDLATVINKLRVGERIEIEFWREGQRQTVTVTLRAAN